MAKEVGTLEQYQGPFNAGKEIQLNGSCIIGISIKEDDFMQQSKFFPDNMDYPNNGRRAKIEFTINDISQTIAIGRTYIYQTETQMDITRITFPYGAPNSLLLNVVYCNALE